MEQVDRLVALAAYLGIEVDAARLEAAHLEYAKHAFGGEVDACGELVRVPAEHRVAGVGVDGAERVGGDGDFEFVLHLVTGQGGVVGL